MKQLKRPVLLLLLPTVGEGRGLLPDRIRAATTNRPRANPFRPSGNIDRAKIRPKSPEIRTETRGDTAVAAGGEGLARGHEVGVAALVQGRGQVPGTGTIAGQVDPGPGRESGGDRGRDSARGRGSAECGRRKRGAASASDNSNVNASANESAKGNASGARRKTTSVARRRLQRLPKRKKEGATRSGILPPKIRKILSQRTTEVGDAAAVSVETRETPTEGVATKRRRLPASADLRKKRLPSAAGVTIRRLLTARQRRKRPSVGRGGGLPSHLTRLIKRKDAGRKRRHLAATEERKSAALCAKERPARSLRNRAPTGEVAPGGTPSRRNRPPPGKSSAGAEQMK